MDQKKFSYYQYRRSLGYSIFVRFEEAEFEKDFVETLGLLGFDPVDRDEVKDIELNPKETKILRVLKANSKVAKKIMTPEFGDSRYGMEQVSTVGGYSLYCFRKVGMLIYGDNSLMWELGIKDASNQSALRAIFTRYLSFALADLGVVGLWAVPIEEGLVVMSPKEANYESVFIDLKKQLVLTFEGEKELSADFQILRLDDALLTEMRMLSSEQLLSFLSEKTTLISPMGLRNQQRFDLLELVGLVTGYIYPASKFQPRSAEAA